MTRDDGTQVHVDITNIPPPRTTFAIVKPGVHQQIQEGTCDFDDVKQDIEGLGFEIVNQATCKIPASVWKTLYKEHKSTKFYPGLIQYMSNKHVTLLELGLRGQRDGDVVNCWRDAIGKTDCSTGLRQKYGTSPPDNAFHGSDSNTSAARELELFQVYFSEF